MYEVAITQQHRAAFIIAIDRSGSMQEKAVINSCATTKSEAVAIITNRLIEELIMRATRDDGVRNYYDIGVIGYGDDKVCSMLGDTLDLIPITTVAARKVRSQEFVHERILPSGDLSVVRERMPMWVEPCAAGSTPMYEALTAASELVGQWCALPQNGESFPPVVFNITDGEATDSDNRQLIEVATRLKSNATADGNALLINVHITGNPLHESIIFPKLDELAGDNYARLLADMSSLVPQPLQAFAREMRGDFAVPPFVAMGYNSSIVEALYMVNIGSRSIAVI